MLLMPLINTELVVTKKMIKKNNNNDILERVIDNFLEWSGLLFFEVYFNEF